MANNARSSKGQEPCLRVIPLGGLHEIGKNTCVFEYGDDLMLVDAGLAFPSDGMHGVNVVLPDTSFLRENQKRIRGMIVTHGHEDHIGGIAHHLKHFNIPVIYGPRLALSMLTGKMDEAGVRDRTTLQTVAPRDVVAACLPDPATIGDKMHGKTCAGTWVTGTGKDGSPREVYLYHVVDNQETTAKDGAQAVVWQTAINAVVGMELLASGTWSGAGVLAPEAFDSVPFLDLLKGDYESPWGMEERTLGAC